MGGRGRLHNYRYTVTTRMTPALRLAAMRDILMFHNCEGQSHKTVSTDHNFRRERRAEADSNRGPSAYQPNALPLGQSGSRYLVRALQPSKPEETVSHRPEHNVEEVGTWPVPIKPLVYFAKYCFNSCVEQSQGGVDDRFYQCRGGGPTSS